MGDEILSLSIFIAKGDRWRVQRSNCIYHISDNAYSLAKRDIERTTRIKGAVANVMSNKQCCEVGRKGGLIACRMKCSTEWGMKY